MTLSDAMPLARPVVFTGLDGILLDRDTGDWRKAAPALAALAARNGAVVLVTARTAAGIAALHQALGLGTTPAIVETGAGLWRPGAATDDDRDYRTIREALDDLPPRLRQKFRGFGDMSAFEVAHLTGLARDAARQARARRHSEPGQWIGEPETLAEALRKLGRFGISARRDGRFLILSLGGTMAGLIGEVAAELGATATLALGGGRTDAEMLDAADRGVILDEEDGAALPRLDGAADGRIIRIGATGPAGWNRAVLDWLAGRLPDTGLARSDGRRDGGPTGPG